MPDYSGIAGMAIPLLMNPHVGGRRPPIMGGPPPEEAERQEQGGGFMDIVSRLFGGAPNPMLEAEQQKEAQKQAMLLAGLQMLAGSSTSEGPRAPGLMQILAGGALTGQQAGAGIQEQMYAQQQEMQKQAMRKQIFDAVGSGQVTRPQLEQMLVSLLRAQDYEGARSLSEYMKSLGGGSQAGQLRWVDDVMMEGKGPYKVLYNQSTGEMLQAIPQYRKPGGGGTDRSTTPQKAVDKRTGKVVNVIYDRSTNEFYEAGGGAEAKPIPAGVLDVYAGAPSEREVMAAFMQPLALAAVDAIDEFEGSPQRLSSVIAKKNWNEVAPEDYQILEAAGKQLGDTYLRITSGAAIKEDEIRMFMETYLPSPGDSAGLLAFKANLRTQMLESVRALAARAAMLGIAPENLLGMDRGGAMAKVKADYERVKSGKVDTWSYE